MRTTKAQPPVVFLDRRELASRWKVSIETIKRRQIAGTLPGFKLGRGLRFKLQDIERIEEEARV